LKEEALDRTRTLWRTHFGRDRGPLTSHATKWRNEYNRNILEFIPLLTL